MSLFTRNLFATLQTDVDQAIFWILLFVGINITTHMKMSETRKEFSSSLTPESRIGSIELSNLGSKQIRVKFCKKIGST